MIDMKFLEQIITFRFIFQFTKSDSPWDSPWEIKHLKIWGVLLGLLFN